MNQTPSNKSLNQQNKDSQLQAFFQFLLKREATATEVSLSTGIPQKNICRYKREMEKAGKLREVRRTICPITKFPAFLITCKREDCHD